MIAKLLLKRLLESIGIHVQLRRNTFGVDWMIDVARAAGPDWKPRVVFDVGANVGQTAYAAHRQWPAAEIYAFEPIASTFLRLQQRTQSLPRVSCHRWALGDRECMLEMQAEPGSEMNSLVAANGNGKAVKNVVEVRTLDSVVAQMHIGHIDILKTDTEGFDMEVLRGAVAQFQGRGVSFVVCEVGFNAGDTQHTQFERVHGWLTARGFWLVGLCDVAGLLPKWSHGYCNAIYAQESIVERLRLSREAGPHRQRQIPDSVK